MSKASLKTLEHHIGYQFKSRDFLQQALAHPIIESEHNNEMLEFLGDRVLGLVLAEYLLSAKMKNEGEAARHLAHLASGALCADIAAGWQLDKYLSATAAQLTERVLANYCEAIIGAVYQDGGLDAAREFILRHWGDRVSETPPVDAKTALQEWAAKQGKALPQYKRISVEGPAHQPVFVYQVSLAPNMSARGEGMSRRQAEQAAAMSLLQQLGVIT